MSSTVTASTLKITITTQIVLGGNERTTTNELNIPNINEYDSRIMSIPSTSEVTVVSFGTVVGQGKFIRGDLRHLQITNKDAVNYARIRVKKDGSDTFDQRLDAGETFMMGNTQESASATAATFATFQDADSVSMQAFNNPVDIEYVIASV